MSMVMFVMGCIAVMAGAAMVAFGIPVNEFSFGNTLISSGTTLATGGLIVVALSAAVGQLHRIAEALAARGPVQPARPLESFEAPPDARAAPAAAAGRVPFPPKSPVREPHPAEPFASPPSLRNPEAAPVTVDDDVSLSPQYPMGGSPAPGEAGEPARPTNGSASFAPRHEPAMDEAWRSPQSPSPPPREASGSFFDNMWPANKPSRGPAAGEPHREARPEPLPHESVARRAAPASTAEPAAAGAPRASVAILKSGVVDGMGYTLYVDGSIEAELPQGTLRFASIDELRSHLEKSS
jgi:hypothetical protein